MTNKQIIATEGTGVFGVFRTGGSLGEISNNAVTRIAGNAAILIECFNNKNDAQALAKRRNSNLTPGEKNYFGIKYLWKELSSKEIEAFKDICEMPAVESIPQDIEDILEEAEHIDSIVVDKVSDGCGEVTVLFNQGELVLDDFPLDKLGDDDEIETMTMPKLRQILQSYFSSPTNATESTSPTDDLTAIHDAYQACKSAKIIELIDASDLDPQESSALKGYLFTGQRPTIGIDKTKLTKLCKQIQNVLNTACEAFKIIENA